MLAKKGRVLTGGLKSLLLFFLFSLLSLPLLSQQLLPQKVKVFLDCSRARCDRTFIITEINIIDFVLDRLAADVHVLITAQRAGSGGEQYQLIFYGQHNFKGRIDTLSFSTTPIATAAEIREQMVHSIKAGLIPFLAKTPYGAMFKIDMKGEGKNANGPTAVTKDKWNYWVFRVGSSGEVNGEQVYKNTRLSADISANRTTENLKVEFYMYGSKRNSKYEYATDAGITEFEVKNSDYGFFHNIVRAFNSHWSYGYQTSLSNNTFSNFQRKIYFNPAIEFNIFPYQEVNYRFFVLRYGLDVTSYRYFDTTIYNHLRQTLLGHRFSAALTFNQKWGTFNSGLYYRNFLYDWRIRSMGININLNMRITGGLSFEVHASGGILRDQIYLKKGGVTEQEVLTRRRQLASSYNYRTSFGLSYRFGSILNNFINPRFDGYGGF